METSHRTESSSKPDLLSLLSFSSRQPSHKRTISATEVHFISDDPAYLHSFPSFSFDDLALNEPYKERDASINGLFTFACDPIPTGIRNKRGYNAVPLFLARGLGIDRVGSELLDVAEMFKGKLPGTNGYGEEHLELDMKLKKIVEEEPGNATALKDYAQFLHQTKGDAKRAEEYYSRAILADPADGEILVQYAKLVWDQHADAERSRNYFEKAVQVSPENSHVFAAYAVFLWEMGDDNESGGQN